MMAELDPGRLDRARDRLRDAASPAPYLTVQEVAELARCEHKAVRRAIASGQLEAFRPAHKWLVREQDARAWVESRPARPVRASASPRARGRRPRPAPGSRSDLLAIERAMTDT